MMILPAPPAVELAVKFAVRVSAPGPAGPPPLRQPIVKLAPDPPLIVPAPESAVVATVVPAAIGFPFWSCTVNVICAEVACVIGDNDEEMLVTVMFAAEVDMMSR